MTGLSSGTVADHVLKMQQTHVFVAGDVILDQYISGQVTRISPEAPVPVVVESARKAVLGGAANVAANILAFGGHATLSGRVGIDGDGRDLMALCHSYGIDTSAMVRVEHFPTTRKLRVLAGYQQVVRIDHENTEPITAANEDQVLASFRQFAASPRAKALVISDYGKGFCTPSLIKQLIAAAAQSKIPVITDPKSADLSRYQGTTVLKPNLAEGREILRRRSPGTYFSSADEEVEAICDAILKDSGARNVVLSLSEKGVIVRGADIKQSLRFKSEAQQVADVSGAGDTMIAFLATGAAAGLSLARTVQLSNIAAGIVCGKLGTATISSAEFFATFNEGVGAACPEKLVTAQEMSQLAHQFRASGRKVVFTNGCFDLLHTGHVTLLQKARGLGHVLVVGLNADASVKRLKGDTRPLQTETDRASILAGLACVDFIVLFSEDTPLELIKAIGPDILVKGGDYRPDQVVGGQEVVRAGGEIAIIPLVEGRSTTKLVEKMS